MPKYYVMILTLGLLVLLSPTNQGLAQSRQLSFYRSVTGNLSENTQLVQDWEFEGRTGQVISLVTETTAGNLDSVLELYDTEGQLLAANDNASHTDTNARLEAIALPATGIYRVRVYREGLETGVTNGDYRLTLLEGFSSYDPAENATLVINPSTPTDLVMLPTAYFYVQAAVNLPTTPYTLHWRFHDTEYTWAFEINEAGAWSLELATPSTMLRSVSGKLDPDMLKAGQRTTFSFWFYQQIFVIRINDKPISTTRISQSLSPLTPGTVQLTLEGTTDLLTISSLWLTTPYYEGTPAEAGAIGPTPPGQRLYRYTGSSQDILAELRNLGYITGGGGIQGEVSDAFVFSDRSGLTTFNLIERDFQNMVIGYQASLDQGVANSACGIIFRQATGATFGTVLFTPAQGLYFLQYDDGYPEGLIEINPALEPGLGRNNHFVLVAYNERGILFVNGRLVGEIPLKVAAGRAWSHVVVQHDGDAAYCRLRQVWLYAIN